MTNLVVKQDQLTYEDKREYLKILRSQLSNHEVALLYYNYISGYGSKWENDENSFFIDYRMLHNIHSELILSEFDPVERLKNIKGQFLYKAGKQKEDTLFEIYGVTSC